MNKIAVNGYDRISKTAAKRRFTEGKETYVVPCKVRIGGPWYNEAPRIMRHDYGDTFDSWINAFTAYNCNYELGYYPAYYVKEVE